MTLYRRGGKWWYEFEFRGQRIRESSGSGSKEVAGRMERARRLSLEEGAGGLKKLSKPLLFEAEAKAYLLDREPHWSEKTREIHSNSMAHLKPHFKRLLLQDIKAEDISRYQRARQKEGASGRSINIEVSLVRLIMRKRKLWANITDDVKMLKERSDIGRALSADEQYRLLVAARASASRSLYPAILLSIHTGLRLSELRLMRWRQVDLLDRFVQVGKSKTAGGEGRIIPLSETAARCLDAWRSNFPTAAPHHAVFPRESYGLIGKKGTFGGKVAPYEVAPDEPIQSWGHSWSRVKAAARVECRWHDLRHTFVSKMAEGQGSDATIMALAGHLSRKMMERYSHTRNEAKRNAISALDRQAKSPKGPHKIPHSKSGESKNIAVTN